PELLGVGGEGALAHRVSLELRELALGEIRMALVELLRGDEPEHRVAQELQPLVVLGAPLLVGTLVGKRPVGERQLEHLDAPEAIAQPLLERRRGAAAEDHGGMVPGERTADRGLIPGFGPRMRTLTRLSQILARARPLAVVLAVLPLALAA